MLDLEQLLSIPCVDTNGGFDLSPDGKAAAFSWNQSGSWEIYLLPLDGSASSRQVTGGPGGKFAPRFSPDGRHLAYLVDLDGGEAFDIWLCDLEQGIHTNLTPGTPEACQLSLSWAPDGARLAYLSDRTGQFNPYLLAVESSELRKISSTTFPDTEVAWSPDGRNLAITSEHNGQDHLVTIVPVDGGEPGAVSLGSDMLNAREACWSPDGRMLAFSSDHPGSYQIGLYSLETGAIAWLSEGEGDHGTPDWSPDGQRLAYVRSLGPDTWICVQATESREIRRYLVDRGVHYSPRFSPDGRQLVLVFDNPQLPDDLWLLDLESGFFRQLTRSLPSSYQETDFIFPEHITYPGLDGAAVPALLYQPETASGRPPAVVVVHGGPNWLFQYLWYPFMQHLASRGWVVLAPNYRGSTGYGRDWQLGSRYDQGGIDADDVVSGADFLAREGLADPERIAVTGRSHGGYLTMSCLTRYPQRWVAGSAVVPFLNWFTSHQGSRVDLKHWDLENMGDPVENYQRWRERSPYFFLDRVESPVQLICGGNDPRCPPGESIAACDQLLALGKPVDFAFYPDEGHAFLKRENVLDAEKRRVDFLARAIESKGESSE